MPTYHHKETGRRFLFVHIPRTAGRFIQENLRMNGFESEQKIWKTIDGVEIVHFHRELYEKHLNVAHIEQIAIIRDPIERYRSLKSHPFHPKGWFRPQVDYINSMTHLWNFEDGFGEDFGYWMSEKLSVDFIIRELESDYIQNEIGQNLYLEYLDPHYNKVERTDELVEYVRSYYKRDFML